MCLNSIILERQSPAFAHHAFHLTFPVEAHLYLADARESYLGEHTNVIK